MRARCAKWCLWLLPLLCAGCEGEPPTSPVVRFLDRSAAAEALLTDDSDRFFEQITTLDIALQLHSTDTSAGRSAMLEAYRASLRSTAQDLRPSEQRRLDKLFAELFVLWEKLFPQQARPEVCVAKIDGRHFGRSVYFTRGNCIFVPAWQLQHNTDVRLRRVLAHELAHVYGEAHPDFREAAYRLFGFEPIRARVWQKPPLLWQRGLTNPDAARPGYGIMVRDSSGRALLATPCIFSKVPAYAPGPKTYLDHLELRFFEVALRADTATLLDTPRPGYPPEALRGLYEQLGRNTDYIIHPEELLAENMAMLLLGEKGKDPKGAQLLEQLRGLCRQIQ